MTVPCSGLNYGHGGIVRDKGNQARATARDQHVNPPARFDQVVNRIASARIQQLDCAFGNSVHLVHDLDQFLIAAHRFLAATQHNGIAGLEH